MLNTFIRAAGFLYSHSPAPQVTARHDTLVVRGNSGDELADALFSLLFTTAFCPGVMIRLIRLMPAGAKEAELDFLCRNEEGISAFARREYAEDGGNRPLGICFLEDSGFDAETERERIAWAVDLDGGKIPAGEGRWTAKDIPETAAEEENCEVLRIARRVHTAYTAGWNPRYTEKEITAGLYGTEEHPAEGDGWYCLRSSLRMAVSIPWKLAAAGIRPDDHAPEALYRKLNAPDGKFRNLLAWQEHRSWQAFMALDGWRMPSPEEMDGYLFRDGNDHRNKQKKWHPCLCDLEHDDWNEPHPCSLRKKSIHEWSREQAAPEGYCLLDRMSLRIHHICKTWVLSDEYGERMDDLFRDLEAALLAPGVGNSDRLISLAGRMENLFLRLRGNETNSAVPWRQVCADFEEALAETENTEKIREILEAVRREAGAAVERNSYRDYKETDAQVIRWLPWIISQEKIDTVWKLWSSGSLLENLLSAIILRPARLHILCEKGKNAVPLEAFRELLKRHGTEETEIRVTPVSDLEDRTVPAGPHDAVDVTGCGEMQHRLRVPSGARVIYYGNHDLQDKLGAPFFAPLYHPYDFELLISEMLRLRGLRILSENLNNEMLGMENDYRALWQAREAAGGGRVWRHTIHALRLAEKANHREIYRKTNAGFREYRHAFQPENYEILGKTGAISVLQELERAQCISGLQIDPVHGQVACRIFPAPKGDPRYGITERELSAMLDDLREDSFYAFDDNFVKEEEPCFYINLADPFPVDPDRLSGLVRAEDLENASQGTIVSSAEAIRDDLEKGIAILKGKGLLAEAGGGNTYRYKSVPVRCGLEKEGSALEAFVYYTLFLSGSFDDVRSNVRYQNGTNSFGRNLEKEIDILVTRKGRAAVISCKDTNRFDLKHIGEIRMQADMYGINAKPVLVCAKPLRDDDDRTEMCD